MRRISLMVLGMAALAYVSQVASAGTVYVQIDSYNTTGFSGSVGGGSPTSGHAGGAYAGLVGSTPVSDFYCVELLEPLGIGGADLPYGQSTISRDGTVNGGTVNNAAEVAYLLQVGSSISATDYTTQNALQAAIWFFTGSGSSSFALDPATTYYSTYTGYIAAATTNAGTVALSDIAWITPYSTDLGQGQGIAYYDPATTSVPEPSTFALLGLGGIGLAVRAYRRRRAISA